MHATDLCKRSKVTSTSFQLFPNSYFMDPCYHYLSSDAAIRVSQKCAAIGEPEVESLFS